MVLFSGDFSDNKRIKYRFFKARAWTLHCFSADNIIFLTNFGFSFRYVALKCGGLALVDDTLVVDLGQRQVYIPS